MPGKKHIDLSKVRYLVLEGGGVRGGAYAGVLEELTRMGIMPKIRRVAGTSAGAITATLLAVGYSTQEIAQILSKLDFNQFLDDSTGVVRDIHRLRTEFGWYKGDAFLAWIKERIAEKTGDPNITFQELHDRRKNGETQLINPFLVSVNLDRTETEVFSYKNERFKDISIADATRASMSIPLYFKAHTIKGERFIDGGIINNFPIDIFDREENINDDLVHHYNSKTLGIRLDSKEEIQNLNYLFPKEEDRVDGFISYIKRLLLIFMAQQNHYFRLSDNRPRTMFVDTLDIGSLEFDITEERLEKLIESGRQACRAFCEDDTPAMDDTSSRGDANSFEEMLHETPGFTTARDKQRRESSSSSPAASTPANSEESYDMGSCRIA